MEMNTFVAWIRHAPTGATVRVLVQADSLGAARMILEAQYGTENIVHWPAPLQ